MTILGTTDVTFFGVLATIVATCVIYLLIKRAVRKRKYKFPPGPPRLPIVGNAHNIDVRELHKSLYGHRDKYGDMSSIHLSGKDIVILNSTAAVRVALETAEDSKFMMNRPPSFNRDYVLYGDIGFQDETDDLRKLRHVTYTSMTSKIRGSNDVIDALNEEFGHLKSTLLEYGDESFDPSYIFALSSINCAISMLIGRRLDYKHDAFKLFLEFDDVLTVLSSASARLVLGILPAIRYLPFSYGPPYQRIIEIRALLAKYFLHDVRSETEPERRCGIIHDLMRVAKKHDDIRDENIEGVMIDTYTGVVTVRLSLLALFYHLIHSPRVQREIYEEIIAKIGKSETPRVEHAELMPYTQAAILESLRLTSVTPTGVPRCNSDDVIVSGYCMPRGTIFMTNTWRINHDEEFWEDPWKYKPERFLDRAGKLVPEASQAVLSTFGIGKRKCLGQEFTTTRLFLYVVNICQTIEVYPGMGECGVERDPRDYEFNTVISVPPYKVHTKPRSQ